MQDAVGRVAGALASLRLTDLLDVVVVAVLLYAAYSWFRRSRARFALVGLALFGALYLVSRALDMYLTRLAFQTVVTVVLVAAVVIFQDDLRRAAERLTVRRWLRRNNSFALRDDSGWVDVVVETLATLSRERIGALVVVKGNDRIEHYLTGGVPLGGKPSTQLLLSLFDPRSPGHDGAVILHRGRVARFGAHLPLSTNVDDSGWLGTRHAAALGLAERTDALVLVVSEESGRIRVAEDGRLVEVASVEPLKARIEAFLRRVQPRPEERSRRVVSAFTRRLPSKGLSLLGALALWFAVVGVERELSTRTLSVPIALVDVPDGWDVTAQDPAYARVTLSGSTAAFRVLDLDELRLEVSAHELAEGRHALAIDRASLDVPGDLAVRGIEPGRVVVEAHPMVRVRVAVRPTLAGTVPEHLQLVRVTAEPRALDVLLPRQRAREVMQVLTEPADVGNLTESATFERPLMLPRGARLPDDGPGLVRVHVVVAPRGKNAG